MTRRSRLIIALVGLLVAVPAGAFLPGAIAPVLYGGGTSAGAAVGMSSSLPGWLGLLGAGIWSFIGVSDSTGYTERLPTTGDPALAVPPPLADQTVQATIPKCKYSTTSGSVSVGTAVEACQTFCTTPGYYGPPTYSSCTSSVVADELTTICNGGADIATCRFESLYGSSTYVREQTIYARPADPPTCPDGYEFGASGLCELVDARLASPDNNCDFQRSGASVTLINDPDCGGGQLMSCDASGRCWAAGTMPSGRDGVIILTPDSGGGSTIEVREERLVDNTTVTDTVTVVVGPDGTVGAVSGGTTTGGVSTDPTTGAPTQTQTGTEAQPNVVVNFPTDYARTGEAQTAANTLAPKLDTLHNDLSVTQNVADPVLPDVSTMPDFGSTFDGLKGWTLPGHSAVCPTGTLDLQMVLGSGATYTFDAHCQLVTDNWAALRAAMVVVWSMFALFIVLRA